MADGERRATPAAHDLAPRAVLAVAAAIVLTLVLAAAAIWGLLHLWGAPIGSGPNAPRDFQPAAPQLAAAPQDERAAYFADKEKWLSSYGWVDRPAGIAHIPIDTAMQLLAAGGSPPDGQGGRR